jgi:hypothetical protein
MHTTPTVPFVETAGAMASSRTALQGVETFFGLFHEPGERFFVSFRGPGETQIKHHEPFDDPALAAARSVGLAAAECDLYFTPATLKPGSERRLAAAVKAPNGLWLDLDKDPYGSLEATLAALNKFGSDLGVPPSVVVRTGNGFHAYWCAPLALETWADLARRLVGAADKLGLRIKDTGPTTNAACILRVPWSTNWKDRANPLEVSLIARGEHYAVATLRTALQDYEPPKGTWARAAGKFDPDKVKFRRAGGLNPTVFCPQIAQSLSEGGARDGYDLWTTNLQVGTKIDDADEWSAYVRRVSEKHPGYHPAQAEWKASTFTHPPRCARYDHLRPGICPRCPSWGRIASPVVLWNWEVLHAPERKRAIDAEIDRFRSAYASDSDPRKALGEVERVLRDLKARDPGLARDCAHRLMALIVKWGWPEHVAKNAGVAAGLDEAHATRWALKLTRAESAKENAPRPAVG